MYAQIDYNCESGHGTDPRVNPRRHTMAITLNPGTDHSSFFILGGGNMDLLYLAVQTEMSDLVDLNVITEKGALNLEDACLTLLRAVGCPLERDVPYLYDNAEEDYGPLQVRSISVVVGFEN